MKNAESLDAVLDALGDGDDARVQRLRALAMEMAESGTGRDGPVREICGLLGDRWSSLILLVLDGGIMGHAELRRVIGALSDEGGISQRMLTLKLRALERNGMLHRTVSDAVPPRVDYALTAMGEGLVGQLKALIGWIRRNLEAIESAREEFQAGPDE